MTRGTVFISNYTSKALRAIGNPRIFCLPGDICIVSSVIGHEDSSVITVNCYNISRDNYFTSTGFPSGVVQNDFNLLTASILYNIPEGLLNVK